MSFDSGTAEAGLRTMTGVSACELADKARELGLFSVGANCDRGLEGYQTVIRQLVEAAGQAVVIAKLSAGVPQIRGGQAHYGGSPEDMAQYALWCARRGVGIIGGCCGATPTHIEAMARALAREGRRPEIILITTSSEVSLALAAREELARRGLAARVVSMPSWELFEGQPQSYKDEVLPPDITARLAIEAGVPQGWCRYVGSDGGVLGLERFGASAPGKTVLEKLGFTVENVVARAQALLQRRPGRIEERAH